MTGSSDAGSTDAGTPDPAEVLHAVVTAVPGVVSLYRGSFGEIATYLPGRKVPGIRRSHDGTEVHVVVAQGADLRSVAAAVHRAAAPVADGPVHVFIDDLAPTPVPSSEEF